MLVNLGTRTRWLKVAIVLAALVTPSRASAQSTPIGVRSDSGSVYGDPARYAQRKAEWLTQVEARPQDLGVLQKAADFFMILDRPLAQDLLERARAVDPDNPNWTERLAQLHKLNAAGGDVGESIAALAEAERAHAMAIGSDRVLPVGFPEMAFDAGDLPKAAAYAQTLLNEAPTYRNTYNYGNAIHKGNLVLGRIAVREGRLRDAVTFLRASGGTPGSPQLNSFGPNMSLAKDILEQGERGAVLDYFELCRVFWTMGGARLDTWANDVRAGRVPSFGANLRY